MMSDPGDRFNHFRCSRPVLFRVALVGAAVLAIIVLLSFHFFSTPPAEKGKSGPSRAKQETPVPRMRPEKQDYRFGHHMEGPYPFEYEPPVQPGRLAHMLGERIAFGSYRLDDDKPLISYYRVPARKPPTLGDQGWHVKKRSYPNLLGAFRDRLPKALESEKPPRGPIGAACKIAVSEDAPAAVAFAEANLRLASPKKLPGAINRLAASYWLGREYDRLDALLEAGLEYRPTAANCSGFPDELESILKSAGEAGRPATGDRRSAGDVRPKAVVLQLALICGDLKKAEAALEKIKKEKVAKTYAPLVERLQKGLKASAGNPKQKKQLKKAFSEARRQMEDVRESVHKRFADWPIQRLEKHLAWTVHALGGYCDPVADILPYMVEQRDYRRVNVHSGTALIAAKRLAHRGEPARALPMFLLCQKLGYLSEEGQFDEDEPNAMVAFNAFEAPIYFARTILGGCGPGHLREMVSKRDDIYRVATEMYDFTLAHCRDDKSAGIAGRHGYEAVALKTLWDLGLQTNHAGDVLGEMKTALRKAPTSEMRSYAAVRLAAYYRRNGQYRKSADIAAAHATGEVLGKYSTYGLRMLKKTAEKSRDPAIARLVRTSAGQILSRWRSDLPESAARRVERLSSFTLRSGKHN